MASIDRTGCPGRPGAHDPCRVGTPTAFKNWGCRCPDTRSAHLRYRKHFAAGRRTRKWIPVTGSSRRLQALATLGYSSAHVAKRIGVGTAWEIERVRTGFYSKVTAKWADAIAALYLELHEKAAPSSRGATLVRRHAESQGWAPPIAWDDDTIDDPKAKPQHRAEDDPQVIDEVELGRLLRGQLPAENTRRRGRLNRVAIKILTERGLVAEDIANLLKISMRSVARIRSELGIAQTPGPTVFETNPGLARAEDRKPVGLRDYADRHPRVGTTPPAATPEDEAPAA